MRAADQQRLRDMCCDSTPIDVTGGRVDGQAQSTPSDDSSEGSCHRSFGFRPESRWPAAHTRARAFSMLGSNVWCAFMRFLQGGSRAEPTCHGKQAVGDCSQVRRAHVSDCLAGERLSSFIEKREAERRVWVEALCDSPRIT